MSRPLTNRFVGVFLTAFLVIVSALTFTPRASAAVGDIVLDNPQITTTKDQLQQWDYAQLTLDWSAPDGIQGGETFEIEFPPEISPDQNFSFPLVSSDGVQGGTCQVTPTSMVCTLNDAFAGMDNVNGTVSIEVQAKEVTAPGETSVELILDGVLVTVPLPGDGIVGSVSPSITGSQKWGWAENNYTEFVWPVIISGEDVAKLGTAPLTITDTLGGGHVFPEEPGNFSFYELTPEQFETNPWHPSPDSHLPIQSITVDPSRTSADVVVSAPTGGWDDSKIYILFYRTVTEDGKPANSQDSFENTATVNGMTLYEKVVREEGGDGSIEGVPRGSFDIEKVMADSSVALPANTTFTVEAIIDSPADSFDGTETYTITAGKITNGGTELPAGTKVTLHEVNLPTIDGYTFNTPKFTTIDAGDGSVAISDDGATAVVTIASTSNVQLRLTNTLQAVATTSSTVSSSAPSTTSSTEPTSAAPSSTAPVSSEPTPSAPTQPTTVTTAFPTTGNSIIPIPLPIPIPGSPGSSEPSTTPTDAVLGVRNAPPAPAASQQTGQPQKTSRMLANTGANSAFVLLAGSLLALVGIGLIKLARRAK
ncbi:Ig-like domain-containing protein [Corynebacterium sp. H130]|uniref:Ig-like domain-containing protein n=1 Tax=Corynebacterium sp. H130 TaxID=3133444 RepID=UPI0030A7D86D